MIIKKTNLEGVFEIENQIFKDHRGLFVKTFHSKIFADNDLEVNFKESFYSISKKNVLRGMHFQCPPHDHVKLVYVASGEIMDVAVDIRQQSPTFGNWYSTVLSSKNARSLYMGKGFAHGFLALSDLAIVVYLTSSVHSPESDSGIRWDSFGFEWGVEKPIISDRDANFNPL